MVWQAEAHVIGGGSLEIINFTATIDNDWSPFVQAQLTIRRPPAADMVKLRAINAAVWVRLIGSNQVARPLSALTADFGGKISTLPKISGLGSTDILTARYSADVAPGLPPETLLTRPSPRRWRLFVTELDDDRPGDEISLRLASGEVLMQRYTLTQTTTYIRAGAGTHLEDLFQAVTAQMGLPAAIEPTGLGISAPVSWEPGVTAWDFLAPLYARQDRRLSCSAEGDWEARTLTSSNAGSWDLDPGAILEQGWTSDPAAIVNGVLVTYTWTDADGIRRREYDTATRAGTAGQPVLTVDRETPYPGTGEAAQILRKVPATAQTVEVTALQDLYMWPGQTVPMAAGMPSASILTTRITFTYPEGIMTLNGR
ncbi:hypothetical protein [Mycetocola saprophilus]|uniref:hypothetical protein n=1 Tax=Mycetocola saprophilus TaxID=76636 RepID=UPI003BEFAD3C